MTIEKGMTEEDFREIARNLDPTSNRDLRRFFILQAVTPYFSPAGKSHPDKKKFFSKVWSESELYNYFKIDKIPIKFHYIIPRREWELDKGIGDYREVLDFINKRYVEVITHFTPKHDKIIFRSCTSKKPYQYTKVQNSITGYDWAVISYNIVPKQLNNEYPFAFYCGFENGSENLFERLDNKTEAVFNFLKAFPYKKIIDYTRPVFYDKGKIAPSPFDLIKMGGNEIDYMRYEKKIVNQFSYIDWYNREGDFVSFLSKINSKEVR